MEPKFPDLDPSLPAVSIQFRMADGRKFLGKFNPSHTVGDVYASLSDGSNQNFALSTQYPKVALNDMSATISSASLANSVVLQTIK